MRNYVELNGPLYPFGYGLTYTTFSYSAPRIDRTKISKTESVQVSVDITNTGKKTGEEVVQLYISDKVSTGIRPVKELKDFARISLSPGETKTVKFTITPDKLEYYNLNLEKVIEPGEFEVLVGPNSEDLKGVSFEVI
jgi:beta-glucosidase